jgi:hypothetical protein
MRIAVCIAAVVLAGCISGPLAAQTAADVASDQELLAAYCLGREEQGLKDWSLLGFGSEDERLASLNERIKRDYAHEIDRLQAYLRAHGLGIAGLRSNLANAGMSNARLRGPPRPASSRRSQSGVTRRCVGKILHSAGWTATGLPTRVSMTASA